MSERFVDGAETVEVDVRRREGPLRIDVFAQREPELRAVVQSGEPVVLDMELQALPLLLFDELVGDEGREHVDVRHVVFGKRQIVHRRGRGENQKMRGSPDLHGAADQRTPAEVVADQIQRIEFAQVAVGARRSLGIERALERTPHFERETRLQS